MLLISNETYLEWKGKISGIQAYEHGADGVHPCNMPPVL